MEALVNGLNTPSSVIAKTFIILPAYNEATALSRLIPNILQNLGAAGRAFEIIVVNDGSSDDSSRLLSTLPSANAVRELRHPVNRGYGFALKTGLLWVADHANGNDAVVTLDADNTQDPSYIPRLLGKLEEGYDAVTASYTMEGGKSSGVPWTRKAMSAFLNRMFQSTISLPGIRTYTNGFRAYRVSALQAAHQKYKDMIIQDPGFPGGTEFFIKIAGLGSRLAEIPFDLHYEHRGKDSKIRLGNTIGSYLRLLWRGRSYAHP